MEVTIQYTPNHPQGTTKTPIMPIPEKHPNILCKSTPGDFIVQYPPLNNNNSKMNLI